MPFTRCTGYKGSSDAFIDASVQLALAGARKINAETGKRVHILVPDEGEFKRSAKMYVPFQTLMLA